MTVGSTRMPVRACVDHACVEIRKSTNIGLREREWQKELSGPGEKERSNVDMAVILLTSSPIHSHQVPVEVVEDGRIFWFELITAGIDLMHSKKVKSGEAVKEGRQSR